MIKKQLYFSVIMLSTIFLSSCSYIETMNTENKFGYINKKGEYVFPLQFEDATYFKNGEALVSYGNSLYLIDKKGNILLVNEFIDTELFYPVFRDEPIHNNPELNDCYKYIFNNGLGLIYKNEKFGYIDKTGKIVIEPQFDNAGNFNNDVAFVVKNGNIKFINKKGKYISNLNFEEFNDYLMPYTENQKMPKDDLIAVKLDNKWGYINKKGALAIKNQFEWAEPFSEGLAAVKIKDKWGYIDKTGKFIIKPKFNGTYCFSEGLASFRIGKFGDGKYGYIDKKGEIIIEPQFDIAQEFSEGLAIIGIGKFNKKYKFIGKYGFIDKKGIIVIEPKFDDAKSFSEGLTAVKIKDKWGYINKTGKLVISLQFNKADYFLDGLALVNTKESKIIEFNRPYFGSFKKVLLPPKLKERNK